MLATDASGGVVWKEQYQPYGDPINRSPAGANNSIWFAGKPYDSATGLSYMGARYYQPSIGRFMAIDPRGFDDKNVHSFNRYAYANNNPYKYVDPDGHSPIDVAFLVYDLGKLAQAVYTGTGVAAAAIDVGLSVVGVASPIPFAGQAAKAAKAVERTVEASRVAGKAREAQTARELAKEFGEGAVQAEQYLRTADGKIAKDLLTGEGRRIDHVVVQEGKAVKSVETTSQTANKAGQQAKEARIRDEGGTFIRDRSTGKLVDLKDVPTELRRRD
jgi:RHS repeat-associated protein